MILKSIDTQTKFPDKIIILIDKYIDNTEYGELKYVLQKDLNQIVVNRLHIVSNINTDFVPWKWVSYVRNYWISISDSEFVYLIDDDNKFEQNFFSKSVEIRDSIKKTIKKDFLLSPTIIYRQSRMIQSQWLSKFNFLLSKVVLNNLGSSDWGVVKMIWGNSLFGPAFVFKKILFDERFEFVYEDLDFTYRVSRWWFAIVVSSRLKINHMERDKTKIERSFIWDNKSIYQKSRNRILFVKKNWSLYERGQFFICWLWIQTFWFLILILLHGKWKIWLVLWMIRWIKDWFIMRVVD